MENLEGKTDGDKGKEGDGDPKPEPKAADDPKVMTQAEVNALVGRTRTETAAKYAGFDEIKTELETLKTANLTDEERREKELATAQRHNADADERIASMAINAEIKWQAAQMGLVDPEAAMLLLDRASVTYSDETGVQGVDAALGVLVEQRSYLKGGTVTVTKPNLDAGGSAGDPVTALTEDQRDTAAKLFAHLPPAEREAEYIKGLAT
jgi:hypothetical protein